ncbi:N-ethylmaleimide reductase [Pseudomonas extremaustralis]|uniref:N-ethylmaleimide reductase n=1 Tax=Pseudomonas extremaustralis TaxID=359110 RepID=A0A5M9J3S7_9PSED|nr:alkene reductase [Pseudomonas extremaustralis]KAA8562762.1 N-ethylmaleimide reductase [Pseudomonas extremaustralis]
MPTLLDTFNLGDLALKNRIIMSPLTRARAGEGDVPTALMAEYYAQRASAGMIITEATNVSPMSRPFDKAPGLFTAAQLQGWQQVTHKVHEKNGLIVAQLWHGGRIGAMGLLDWNEPLSPSGLNDDLEELNVWGRLENGNYVRVTATPSRAMRLDEIKCTIDEYKQAAKNAVEAGFDGVEIHAASGYLPHQFLSARVNQRDDEYGGRIENRAKFLVDIIDAVAQIMPLSRVGVRISPYAAYNNALDDQVEEMYGYLADIFNQKGVAFVHIADTNGWFEQPDLPKILKILKGKYTGAIIANGGLSVDTAQTLVSEGTVPLVAFGRYYIANPDLVERIRDGLSLNPLRERDIYGSGAQGYTDYPAHAG